MKLYCGIDLHSNNHWLTVIDESDRRVSLTINVPPHAPTGMC